MPRRGPKHRGEHRVAGVWPSGHGPVARLSRAWHSGQAQRWFAGRGGCCALSSNPQRGQRPIGFYGTFAELTMSGWLGQKRALRRIERELACSDPRLVALFLSVAGLGGGKPMPEAEMVR